MQVYTCFGGQEHPFLIWITVIVTFLTLPNISILQAAPNGLLYQRRQFNFSPPFGAQLQESVVLVTELHAEHIVNSGNISIDLCT